MADQTCSVRTRTNAVALVAGLALIATIAGAQRALAAEFTVTDLGTLGGARSSAFGLNEAGEVVGDSDTAEKDVSRAFIYSGGTMKSLGTLGGPRSLSSGRGINFDGKAVGNTDLFPDRHLRGFLYSDGTMTDIGSLGGTEPFPSGTRAEAINAAGKIVGSSHTVDDRRHAFLYSDGVMTDLGTLPGGSSEAYAINDAGQIVGLSRVPAVLLRHHAFLYSGGVMTDLGTLAGGEESRAFAINAAGQIVGDSALSGITRRHAFLYSGGTMIDLGTLGGGESFAKGINTAGVIVGLSDTPNDGPRHGFIYRGGKMIDLNTLVPAGVVIKSAAAINSAGQIAATGTVNGSNDHAVLLTPKLLNRIAYAWADQPSAADYTPAPQYAYNSAGGPIRITRQSVGVYDVAFESLPGWGNNGLSSAVSVTAYGSSAIACSLASYASSPNRAVATVSCFNIVTKASADSRFTVIVVGNQSVPMPSAFVFSGGAASIPPPNPAWSWTSGHNPITVSHNAGPGDYNVLLGTGNTPKSAKLVTGSGGATRCNNAGGVSGGLRVRCYDFDGAPSDQRFWVLQIAGGLSGRRIGFAVTNRPTTPSYTPAAGTSFNSSGGAITATRLSAGRYAIVFAGLQKLAGHTEHVQVTSVSATLAICKVVSWGNSANGLRVVVECRNGTGQFTDSRYGVLVIE